MKLKFFKLILSISVISALVIILISCKKEVFEINDTNIQVEEGDYIAQDILDVHIIKKHDTRMENLGRSLAISLKDVEVRSLIKAEVSKQWNGDYEFLYKHSKDKSASKSSNASLHQILSNNMIVDDLSQFEEELLSYDLPKSEKSKIEKGKISEKSLKETYLEQFSSDFPCLQIAVRGPVEEWDVNSKHPLVVYIPADFDEHAKSINAFDENGSIVELDLTQDFTHPVVVLMKSERTDFYGKLLPAFDKNSNLEARQLYSALKSSAEEGSSSSSSSSSSGGSTLDPDEEPATCPSPSPVSLTLESRGNSGNYLTWTHTLNYPAMYTQYILYRDGGGETNKRMWAGYGNFRSTYDRLLEPGNRYRYKMRVEYHSRSGICYSPYSNYTPYSTEAPTLPNVPNFTAECTGGNSFFLRWNSPGNLDQFTGYKINRYVHGSSRSEHVADVSKNTYNYIDSKNKTSGASVVYWLQTYGGIYESEPVYDYDMNCERVNGDELYINSIKCINTRKYESALYGKPEFEIAIAHVDHENNQVKEWFQQPCELTPSLQDGVTNGVYVGQYNWHKTWDNSLHKKVLVIAVNEHDNTARGSYANMPIYKAIKAGIDLVGAITPGNEIEDLAMKIVNAGFNFSYALDPGDDEGGEAYYAYWWPTDHTIIIDGDIYVRISNMASTHLWLSSWN